MPWAGVGHGLKRGASADRRQNGRVANEICHRYTGQAVFRPGTTSTSCAASTPRRLTSYNWTRRSTSTGRCAAHRRSAAAGAAFKDIWTLSDLDLACIGLIADEQPAMC